VRVEPQIMPRVLNQEPAEPMKELPNRLVVHLGTFVPT
jgi:hypothetical protein